MKVRRLLLKGTSLHMDWRDVQPSAVRSRAPLSGRVTTISFTILELAHAIVKADAVRRIHPRSAARRAIGFLWEWGDALASSGSNLRLDAVEYTDFVGRSLTARIGQGLALLYSQRQGYQFLGHYPILSGQKGRQGPDFVLENRSGLRAFLEAKASAAKSADIKGKLKEALEQIRAGFRDNAISSVNEGYATLSLLRRLDDRKDSEAFVTSVSHPRSQPAPPDDNVIRANYGTWLRLMGHSALAAALLSPGRIYRGPRMRFALREVGGRTTAFAALSPFWMLPVVWPVRDYVLAVGLEWECLRYLAYRARQGARLEAERLRAAEVTETRTHEISQEGLVSIFADTTALGILPRRTLSERQEEI